MDGNKDLMRALQELRKGSRTSRHVLKQHKGSRSDKRRRAINDGRREH